MVQSEDLSLDRLIRHNVRNATMLKTVEVTPEDLNSDNQIAIFDCREKFPNFSASSLPETRNPHSNIALIHPEIDNRKNVFSAGFMDFLSWPILTLELSARLLIRCSAPPLNGPKFRYSRFNLVEQCCGYMAEHISESISVQALAQMFNTNHNTLTTMFKREMGLTPIAWQRKLRLECAANQLLTTDSSITEVSAEFGYEFPGNFATAFQRHFGATPHEYRKSELRRS